MSEPLVGEVVDTRYELRRLIARGGMSLVFEAHHKFTRRAVALKLLPSELRGKREVRGRLLREAYALAKLGYDHALLKPPDFRLTAAPGVPTMSVEEMIATTDRGVLVTRFSGVQLVDFGSLLCTGYTRDGVWLIERGKISKPIQNFRFIESPLFILNNLDAVGTPVRVFAPGSAYVAPPVRVRDFSFVALADAI